MRSIAPPDSTKTVLAEQCSALRGTACNFPLWLAPDQVRVITLNDDAALIDYAQPIVNELRANQVRVDSDFSATPFKAKIADAATPGVA